MGNSCTGISSTAVTPSDFRYGIFSITPRYVPGSFDAAGLRAREAADVHLVDHRLRQAAPQVAVALPIERVVHHDALGRPNDAVFRRQEVAGQRAGIRIDQPGRAVEALAVIGIERAIGLQVIELPRPDARHEHAPDVAPAVGLADRSSITSAGSRSVTRSYSSTRMAVALRLKTTNCTPPGRTTAP